MTIYLPLLCFQVYEHVYETVDIQGNPEVRAQATAKVIKHATSFFFNFLEFSSQPFRSQTPMNISHFLLPYSSLWIS